MCFYSLLDDFTLFVIFLKRQNGNLGIFSSNSLRHELGQNCVAWFVRAGEGVGGVGRMVMAGLSVAATVSLLSFVCVRCDGRESFLDQLGHHGGGDDGKTRTFLFVRSVRSP